MRYNIIENFSDIQITSFKNIINQKLFKIILFMENPLNKTYKG